MMKNTRAMVMIGIAALIGMLAVILAARWLTQQASLATTKVVVATQNVDLGTRLMPEDLQVVDWPRSAMPAGAFSDVNDLLNAKTTEGKSEARVLKVNVTRGEPILESKLSPAGSAGGLSSLLEEGTRAITVSVNEIVGVAGFAQPGSRVDILVSTKSDDGRDGKQISKIVLENVKVLAVAQQTSADPNKPKVVNAATLEVTPEQAEKLDLARSVGTLSLALRNELDKKTVTTTGAAKADLLQGLRNETAKPAPSTPKVAVHRPRPPSTKVSVEVIRGTKKSAEEF